jgi:hypothetical protein
MKTCGRLDLKPCLVMVAFGNKCVGEVLSKGSEGAETEIEY